MAYMDYMDLVFCCPRKATKLNHSLTFICKLISFGKTYEWNDDLSIIQLEIQEDLK